MTIELILAVILIGFAAGLRTFTAPAIVAWAVHVDHIDVTNTPFAFMTPHAAVLILSLAALGEYVFDLMPFAPARTQAPGLIGRFVTGSFSAAVLLAASHQNLAFGILGGLVAIGGAFAGFHARRWCVGAFKIKDPFVAIPEDLLAIGLGVTAVCLSA
jgi:uncharacterized membrane protein